MTRIPPDSFFLMHVNVFKSFSLNWYNVNPLKNIMTPQKSNNKKINNGSADGMGDF